MPLVSIIIPCYQERTHIEACVHSVLAFECPPDITLEVFVVDGGSSDGTLEILHRIARDDPRVVLLHNPARLQSIALNLAIPRCTGEYIMRLDAHSVYPPEYLRLCHETALRTQADNTGGIVLTMARGSGYQASLVQALTTHQFGVGNSDFRTEAHEGPADTVPYGYFRRTIFDRIGLFDVRLARAQDYEFNRRIIASGGTIWLNPAICLRYYQQPDLKSFFRKQVYREAPYNAYLWYLAPYAFAPRHAITGVFALGVLGGIGLSPVFPALRWIFVGVMSVYGLLACGAAVQQARRYHLRRHVLCLPPAFFCYHFLHGVGVLAGLLLLAIGRAPVQGTYEPWPGAGRFRAWRPTPQ